MPKGDKTGPKGQGPRTGRAAGYCAGFHMPGFVHPHGGRAQRTCGPFVGRGWRHRHWYHAGCRPDWIRYEMSFPGCEGPETPLYPPEMEPEEEREALKAQAGHLKHHLEEIEKRMAELKKTKEKK